jgi:flagellar hook assembly protein FlgD
MVFDMSGRVVSILSDEEMQAAEHTLVWDGTDSTGSPVAAGVYFCRLQAAGQTVTQKMLRIE